MFNTSIPRTTRPYSAVNTKNHVTSRDITYCGYTYIRGHNIPWFGVRYYFRGFVIHGTRFSKLFNVLFYFVVVSNSWIYYPAQSTKIITARILMI